MTFFLYLRPSGILYMKGKEIKNTVLIWKKRHLHGNTLYLDISKYVFPSLTINQLCTQYEIH